MHFLPFFANFVTRKKMVIQCLKTNLYSMEIPEYFLVLLHTQSLQPGIYGDVFTGHYLLSLQDNSTKEIKEIQSSFVIPNHFYKTETFFSIKDNSEKKINSTNFVIIR